MENKPRTINDIKVLLNREGLLYALTRQVAGLSDVMQTYRITDV